MGAMEIFCVGVWFYPAFVLLRFLSVKFFAKTRLSFGYVLSGRSPKKKKVKQKHAYVKQKPA